MIRKFSDSGFSMGSIWWLALLSSLLNCTRSSLATEDQVLTIGSQAPALTIDHWLSDGHGRFMPVTEFQPGRVYVIDFWATWCGPCIRSMPHLAKLQEKYADELQIISVSTEPPERIRHFMEREYRTGDEQESSSTYGILLSGYCVASDPDRSCFKDYMDSSVRDTIPTTFIIGRDGKIEFIGHPTFIDGPLAKVIDGTWDREAFAMKFAPRQALAIAMKDLLELLSSDPQQAIERIDSMVTQIEFESEKDRLNWLKMDALARCERYSEATQIAQTLAQAAPDDSVKRHLAKNTVIYITRGGDLSLLSDAVSKCLAIDQDDESVHLNNHIEIAAAISEAVEAGRTIERSVIDGLAGDLQKRMQPLIGDRLAAGLDALARYQYSQGDKALALSSLEAAKKEARFKLLVTRISEFISKLGGDDESLGRGTDDQRK
jgi:thiol-disulfide isomerase/thioredoxin